MASKPGLKVFGSCAVIAATVVLVAHVRGATDAISMVLLACLLSVLGVAVITVSETVYVLTGVVDKQDSFGHPYRTSIVGAVAYSIVYGPRLFNGFMYYDDWAYQHWTADPLHIALAPVLSDHFVPALVPIIWLMVRLFGFDYTGAAVLQLVVFLTAVLGLAHLVDRELRGHWSTVLFVGAFAAWPTYGDGRLWFAGSFWLTCSTAALAVTLLVSDRIVREVRTGCVTWGAFLVAVGFTVLVSSQVLIPGLLIAVYCAFKLADAAPGAMRRLVILVVCSFVFTFAAFVGRHLFVERAALDFSGFYNGRVITNSGFFILDRVLAIRGMLSSKEWAFAAFFLFLAIPFTAVFLAIRADRRRLSMCAIYVLGMSIFGLAVIQVGLARSWNPSLLYTPYYATFPFFGLALGAAGLFAVLRPFGPAYTVSLTAAVWSPALVVVLAGCVAASPVSVRQLRHAVESSTMQKRFLDDLGAAMCAAIAQAPPQGGVRVLLSRPLSGCRACLSFIGPADFVQGYADRYSEMAAWRSCPAIARGRLMGLAGQPQPGEFTLAADRSEAVAQFEAGWLSDESR